MMILMRNLLSANVGYFFTGVNSLAVLLPLRLGSASRVCYNTFFNPTNFPEPT